VSTKGRPPTGSSVDSDQRIPHRRKIQTVLNVTADASKLPPGASIRAERGTWRFPNQLIRQLPISPSVVPNHGDAASRERKSPPRDARPRQLSLTQTGLVKQLRTRRWDGPETLIIFRLCRRLRRPPCSTPRMVATFSNGDSAAGHEGLTNPPGGTSTRPTWEPENRNRVASQGDRPAATHATLGSSTAPDHRWREPRIGLRSYFA